MELIWRKSSYSGNQGGNCVEVAWHKSSYSGNQGGHCVEVAETPRAVYVRDTQNRDLGTLGFSPEAFTPFVSGVKVERR